jgi:hydrogenase maturation protease
MKQQETLILGIGNTLLSDEGAGIHALNQLQSEYQNIPNLTFVDGGTLSFTLAVWIEDCSNLIVFDAAELNQPAGTVSTFVGTAMDDFLGTSKRSAHEVGLLDLMDIARITDHLPENRALIGIQPEYMGWGMKPTAAVQSALDTAVSEAAALIKQWQEVNTDQETSTAKHPASNTNVELSDWGA